MAAAGRPGFLKFGPAARLPRGLTLKCRPPLTAPEDDRTSRPPPQITQHRPHTWGTTGMLTRAGQDCGRRREPAPGLLSQLTWGVRVSVLRQHGSDAARVRAPALRPAGRALCPAAAAPRSSRLLVPPPGRGRGGVCRGRALIPGAGQRGRERVELGVRRPSQPSRLSPNV
jgi:hypothetical protein